MEQEKQISRYSSWLAPPGIRNIQKYKNKAMKIKASEETAKHSNEEIMFLLHFTIKFYSLKRMNDMGYCPTELYSVSNQSIYASNQKFIYIFLYNYFIL